MKKSGGFFVAGIAQGIADSINNADRQVAYMAHKITGTADEIFSNYEIADITTDLEVGADISNDIETRLKRDEMRRQMQEKDDDDSPIALTVKIGEETILDRIINGINERAYMNNMGVLNI